MGVPRTNGTACFGSIEPASRLIGVAPYVPPERESADLLRLDANEGPPCPQRLLDALRGVSGESLRRYPQAGDLEARLARRWGIGAERVVVTAGAGDAIDRLCRVMLEPGRSILIHEPTFEMIPRYAHLAGAEVQSVPWVSGPFPLPGFLAAISPATRLVSLVSPNNPTGAAIGLRDIERVADAAETLGSVVLVDLAYVEYADSDPTRRLLDHPNVVVIRTFSKAPGLAGLRIGYTIAPLPPAPIAAWLRAAGSPYPVSSISLMLAEAALELPDDLRDAPIARIRSERDRLSTLLRRLGAEPLDSQANFVSVPVADAGAARRTLADNGIAVRALPWGSAPAGFVRITLPGDEASFLRLVRALEQAGGL